jgi:hypothetical protein
MIRRIAVVASLCVSPLVTATSFAESSDDSLEIALEEIRNLQEQIQRLEKTIGGLCDRLDKLEGKRADPSVVKGAAARQRTETNPISIKDGQSVGRILPLPSPLGSVNEVLRLQIHSPSRLLNGLHEREEQLRRRLFPPDSYVVPVRPKPIRN